ncbi:MAG: hypothetical protein HY902_16610 [Deltaproteobacteria bacterium]|nr:hypothetical protein [Deltaproteobacteria bacterium]
MTRFAVAVPKILAGLIAVAAAAACSSPLAGRWEGTADLGPIDAWPVKLHLAKDGQSGQVSWHEPGAMWRTFAACRVQLQGRQFEVEFDLAQPDCGNGAQRDRRVLRGTAGERLLFGEILGADRPVGFFRAFAVDAAP